MSASSEQGPRLRRLAYEPTTEPVTVPDPDRPAFAVAWLSAQLVASDSLSTHGGRSPAHPGSLAGCVS